MSDPKLYLEPLRDVGTYNPTKARALLLDCRVAPDLVKAEWCASPSGLFTLYTFTHADGTVERYFTDRS